MQLFEYMLLERDVDYLIIGKGHRDDFQDLNILLLVAMCSIFFREFATKKEASWPQEAVKLPSTKNRFCALQPFCYTNHQEGSENYTLLLGSKSPPERTFSQMNFIWTA